MVRNVWQTNKKQCLCDDKTIYQDRNVRYNCEAVENGRKTAKWFDIFSKMLKCKGAVSGNSKNTITIIF